MGILFAVPVIYYYALTVFVFSQLCPFYGASQIIHSILVILAGLGLLAKLVFLVLYGIRMAWWAPFAIVGRICCRRYSYKHIT